MVSMVSSPNVTDDHQTKNALALSDREAAVMISDAEAHKSLITSAVKLVADSEKREKLSKNIKKMADRDADLRIAEEVFKLAEK